MKMGLISEHIYDRSVKKELNILTDECAASGGVCAFLSKNYCSQKTMFNTKASVISSINELVVKGINPSSVNLNLCMPVKYSEEKMKKILSDVNGLLAEINVNVHSFMGEVVGYVNEPVMTSVAIGNSSYNELLNNKHNVLPGDDIICVGCVGEAGSSIYANSLKNELLKRFSERYVDGMIKDESAFVISKELMPKDANVIPILDGGIYASLWELAKESNVGLDIFLKDIPITQETVEVCNYFDVNPYQLYSLGCFLVTMSDGHEYVSTLQGMGYKASIIGKATKSNDKVIIIEDDRKYITRPCPDELTKLDDIRGKEKE